MSTRLILAKHEYGKIMRYLTYRQDLQYVSSFLAEHPETSSFYVTVNGEDRISYQTEQQRPLASTVKTVIAIEYAHQVADGRLDEKEKVSLAELECFYINGTDGGAHPAWLKELKEKALIDNETVPLHQIAKGMIRYSSNANTEYLMDVLGFENINKRIDTLGLQNHETIYHFVSALLISEYTGKATAEKLNALSDEEYRLAAMEIHIV